MNIIFDLDGTISDSSEGIFANFREFFRIYNLPDLPDETLKIHRSAYRRDAVEIS